MDEAQCERVGAPAAPPPWGKDGGGTALGAGHRIIMVRPHRGGRAAAAVPPSAGLGGQGHEKATTARPTAPGTEVPVSARPCGSVRTDHAPRGAISPARPVISTICSAPRPRCPAQRRCDHRPLATPAAPRPRPAHGHRNSPGTRDVGSRGRPVLGVDRPVRLAQHRQSRPTANASASTSRTPPRTSWPGPSGAPACAVPDRPGTDRRRTSPTKGRRPRRQPVHRNQPQESTCQRTSPGLTATPTPPVRSSQTASSPAAPCASVSGPEAPPLPSRAPPAPPLPSSAPPPRRRRRDRGSPPSGPPHRRTPPTGSRRPRRRTTTPRRPTRRPRHARRPPARRPATSPSPPPSVRTSSAAPPGSATSSATCSPRP